MKTVTFYHSMFCPRCHLAGLALSQLRADFPDVVVEKVEYLANIGRASREGVWLIPSLVAGDKKLSGVLLTKKSMRDFLEKV
jgi:hypothetical protein